MRREVWVLAAVLVLAVTTATGGVVLSSTATPPAHAAQLSAVSTATVQREELSATISQDGTLTYGAQPDGLPYTVINEAQGAYTKLPAVGQVIRQGQVLYRVDTSPVVLLYGATPVYRTLSAGMTGPDVAELNADLVALGYATSTHVNPTSGFFGPATTTGLEKLQAALGLAQNGELTLGQAVVEPTALRVTAVSALLGASAPAGQPAMQGTSTRRQVQVALDAAQQTDVAAGDRVTITLPNNKITSGVVTSVGTVATCASSSGSVVASPTSTTTQADSCSSESPSSSTPTINVDVRPSDPGTTGTWDQAPVQVGITTSRVPHALVVPVTALLAQANGGYAVEVVGPGASNHLVPVSLGLFDDADGVVQVTGSRLTAGERVVVPST
ncbi:MAG TPA: peptidoglycan-binding domain-containing protein [Solirubrobacteraceae bacterium]|nr:peptidoglycan-binding domain-containing protein [Solirubrobacteraceae bacterium]